LRTNQDEARAVPPVKHDAPTPLLLAAQPSVFADPAAAPDWIGSDGRRCGSRWKVQIDHIDPFARGGTCEASKRRLLCARHNAYYAEQVYGREHMSRFRRAAGDEAEHVTRGNAVPGLFVREPLALAWGEAGAA
jgi:hypothetical protein